MKKLIQFILLVTISLFMNSCYYDEIYEPIDNGNGEPVMVSYQNDIVPLWGQCVGCHNGNEPPDLLNNSYDNLLNGFVVPDDADASVLYQSLLGINGVSLMPPGGQWPDNKINLVRDWINQGALDN
jgi:hypothetical protein